MRARVLAALLPIAAVVIVLAALNSSRLFADDSSPSASPRSAGPTALTTGSAIAIEVYVLLVTDVDKPGAVARISGDGSAQRLTSTDFDPAMAATGSVDRIYVLSGLDASAALRTIDARTGDQISQVSFVDRWRNTLPSYFETLAVSPDDRWLYALGFQTTAPERDAYFLRVFDSRRGTFLADVIPLPCGGGFILPGPLDVEFACTHSGLLLSTAIGPNGEIGVVATTSISQSGITGAARLPDRQGTLVLTKDGKIVRVDARGVNFLFEPKGSGTLAFDGLAVSPKGDTVYVARGDASVGRITTLEAFDLTGHRIASSTLEDVAWSMSVTHDGKYVLLPSHQDSSVTVLDATTLERVQTYDVPGSPVQVIAP